MRVIIFAIITLLIFSCQTSPPKTQATDQPPQKEIPVRPVYRASYTKHFDLIHTRLNVSFVWEKTELHGEAALILRPHFYPADSLLLNARGMEILQVSLLHEGRDLIPLGFSYDSMLLRIKLDREYKREEALTIYVKYISRPQLLKSGGSAAITNDRGLYFINADSLDNERPTQFWTQGETESNSVWFPTLEDPGQRMTQEIYITVDKRMTTLSNGLLISSIDNNDGTKTDYWKQSLPAAPYLTMIAAGNYSVTKERWRNIEVSYYVDPPYAPYAKMIFGNTPEMMSFFSEKFNIPYVWEKYAQIVVHDYISGAMENTTAVVHGTNMQQNPRDFIDGNFEDYISHELAHHWFGNLVTTESWSNITLNEGFANYCQYLWREYKYGRDDADRLNQADQSTYLFLANNNDPPLFRTQYNFREDVYDAISYNKGGRVLHMLRKYVGDDAFFHSLEHYLAKHAFSSVEIEDLRIDFEKITGEDLHWFFEQWYNRGGHPEITIGHQWNDSLGTETVTITQVQDLKKNPLYKIPLDIDIYIDGRTERKRVVCDNVDNTFTFNFPHKPDLVNVDAEKMLLAVKHDNKSNEEFIFQFDNAPLYLDRYESVLQIGKNYRVKTKEADMLLRALDDPYYNIRSAALNNIGELALNDPDTIQNILFQLAENDSSSDVREKALSAIGKYFSYKDNVRFFQDALQDTSYKVVARAFKIISDKDPAKAESIALWLENDSGQAILSRLSEFYTGTSSDKIEFYKRAIRLSGLYIRYQVIKDFEKYLINTYNADRIYDGVLVLADRARRPGSAAYRRTCINSIKAIESKTISRIQTLEETTADKNTETDGAEKERKLREMTSLREKIQVVLTEFTN